MSGVGRESLNAVAEFFILGCLTFIEVSGRVFETQSCLSGYLKLGSQVGKSLAIVFCALEINLNMGVLIELCATDESGMYSHNKRLHAALIT